MQNSFQFVGIKNIPINQNSTETVFICQSHNTDIAIQDYVLNRKKPANAVNQTMVKYKHLIVFGV